MAWLAVNYNGQEMIFPNKPFRDFREWSYCETVYIESEQGMIYIEVKIPSGSIEKLTGRKLTWEDEPRELI